MSIATAAITARRDDASFEQVVFGEILVPETLNVYNDWMTREDVKRCAYEFARQGYGVEITHNAVNVAGQKCYVVESFIARDNDEDFIPGSWVVGIKITDDDTWQDILAGKINGFSFDAEVYFSDATFTSPGVRTIMGVTEPDPFDGHTHTFLVLVGEDQQVISGGTGATDGHQHPITVHTRTGVADGHVHRYQIVEE